MHACFARGKRAPAADSRHSAEKACWDEIKINIGKIIIKKDALGRMGLRINYVFQIPGDTILNRLAPCQRSHELWRKRIRKRFPRSVTSQKFVEEVSGLVLSPSPLSPPIEGGET